MMYSWLGSLFFRCWKKNQFLDGTLYLPATICMKSQCTIQWGWCRKIISNWFTTYGTRCPIPLPWIFLPHFHLGIFWNGPRMVQRRAGFIRWNSTITELYDLKSDPKELKNLINNPAYQAEVKELRQELLTWQRSTDDPRLCSPGGSK